MRFCSSPSPSRFSSDTWRKAVLPGQRKRRAGYWWHLSRSGCRLPRPLGDCGSICSRRDWRLIKRKSRAASGRPSTSPMAKTLIWARRCATLAFAIHLNGATTASADRASAGECRRFGVRALPAFGLGVIVVTGIRAGVVAPTEVAALAAAYTLVAAILKRTALHEIGAALRKSARETVVIFDRFGGALRVPDRVDGVATQVSSAAAWHGSNHFW